MGHTDEQDGLHPRAANNPAITCSGIFIVAAACVAGYWLWLAICGEAR